MQKCAVIPVQVFVLALLLCCPFYAAAAGFSPYYTGVTAEANMNTDTAAASSIGIETFYSLSESCKAGFILRTGTDFRRFSAADYLFSRLKLPARFRLSAV